MRTKRFKYIRNFLPDRPYLQPCAYKDAKAILIALRQQHAEGQLDPVQQLLFRETRPAEELFDVLADPHEIHNLADDPAHAATLADLRAKLDAWMIETNDQGQEAESPAMYDSDMEVYLSRLRGSKKDPVHLQTIERNIAQMKQWASEGK